MLHRLLKILCAESVGNRSPHNWEKFENDQCGNFGGGGYGAMIADK